MSKRILRLPEVKALTGKSRSTIYLEVAEQRFPPPVRIGTRAVGWSSVEVEAMNDARLRGESEPAIRSLVTKLVADRKGTR